jgi:uncharacterized protein (UPF0333 family)
MPPAPKKRSPLPWILGGAGVLVVVLVVVLLLVFGVFSHSSTASGAVSAANAFETAVNNADSGSVTQIECSTSTPAASGIPQQFSPSNIQKSGITLTVSNPEVVGNDAALLNATMTTPTSHGPISLTFNMRNTGGRWCVDSVPLVHYGTGALSTDSATASDLDVAKAGECLGGNARESSTVFREDCSNGAAKYKILGVLTGQSSEMFDQSGSGCTSGYPQSDDAFYLTDLQETLCLKKLGD